MELDSTITDIIRNGEPVTITALGGLEAISPSVAASPLFPHVAEALVHGWETFTAAERSTATDLIATALRTTASALVLSDTSVVVVPLAHDLGIAIDIKNTLRDRTRQRDTQQNAAVAAIALRWLTHLAVVTDTARGAVVDVLSEVAQDADEPHPFATTAAQVAGIAFDLWGDRTATECLTRLTEDGSPDAWFALGQARLADALSAPHRDTCLTALATTLECFDYAAANGEQRPDAVMYAHAVRFILAWAANATAGMLADHYHHARTALHEYLLLGHGLPGLPPWLRPRYQAETAWIELVNAMELIADRDPTVWFEAGVAISALADVYQAANSFRPVRNTNAAGAEAMPDLVAPQLVAPFVEHADRLGYLDRWLHNSDSPDAEAFAAFVRERAEKVVPPKHRPPGNTRR